VAADINLSLLDIGISHEVAGTAPVTRHGRNRAAKSAIRDAWRFSRALRVMGSQTRLVRPRRYAMALPLTLSRWLTLAVVLAALFGPPCARAAHPPGQEFVVNTFLPGIEQHARVASDAQGNTIVVWEEPTHGITAQRYATDGSPVGGPFSVEPAPLSQSNPSVAMAADGQFVVAWKGETNPNQQAVSLFFRRFSADGTPKGTGPTEVVATGTSDDYAPVAIDDQGNFVIVWLSPTGLFGRRYSSLGFALTRPFRIDAPVAQAVVSSPSIAMNPAGAFVVTWTLTQYHGDDPFNPVSAIIQTRRYNASAAAQGAPIAVTLPSMTSGTLDSAVGMDDSGGFVIAWMRGDAASTDVYAHRYKADGTSYPAPFGSDFRVNTQLGERNDTAAVAVDSDGSLLVVWSTRLGPGNVDRISGRRFQGVAMAGPVFTIANNGYQTNAYPDVAVDADGDAFVVWHTQDASGGTQMDVHAERLAGPETVDLSLVIQDAPDPVNVDVPVNYTVTVSNLHAPSATAGVGASTGEQVVVDWSLPGNPQSISGTGWTCAQSDVGLATCNHVGPLAAGAQASIVIGMKWSQAGPGVVEADVFQDQSSSSASHPYDQETTTVTNEQPAPFHFTDRTGVFPNVNVTSNAVALSGFTRTLPVKVACGRSACAYSVNYKAFTTAPGYVRPGDAVRVRVRSQAGKGETSSAMLTVGGIPDVFSVTTAP
jgi:hypothetical protein